MCSYGKLSLVREVQHMLGTGGGSCVTNVSSLWWWTCDQCQLPAVGDVGILWLLPGGRWVQALTSGRCMGNV